MLKFYYGEESYIILNHIVFAYFGILFDHKQLWLWPLGKINCRHGSNRRRACFNSRLSIIYTCSYLVGSWMGSRSNILLLPKTFRTVKSYNSSSYYAFWNILYSITCNKTENWQIPLQCFVLLFRSNECNAKS